MYCICRGGWGAVRMHGVPRCRMEGRQLNRASRPSITAWVTCWGVRMEGLFVPRIRAGVAKPPIVQMNQGFVPELTRQTFSLFPNLKWLCQIASFWVQLEHFLKPP